MIIDLVPVFNNEGEKVDIDYSFRPEDESFVTPVAVSGTVANRTGIVSMDAKAKFDYSTACALCNKPLLRHATVPVKHILVPASADNEDNDEFIPVEGMKLDVDGLVSEDIYLAIPTRFLCKEDCKGLCCVCGADLNDGPCGCKKITDPRWDALKSLLDQ